MKSKMLVLLFMMLFNTYAIAQDNNDLSINASDVIEQIEAHYSSAQTSWHTEGFPLPSVTLDELGLPEHFAGYFIGIADVYIPSAQNLVAVNYEYRKGGSIVYQVQYNMHYHYLVSILYELSPDSICRTGNIKSQIAHFQSDDGIYVRRTNGEVIPLEMYFTQHCGISGLLRQAVLIGIGGLILLASYWRRKNRTNKLKRKSIDLKG